MKIRPKPTPPNRISAEHIIRAYRMLTPEQVAEYEQKINPNTRPVIFPCPPVCPPVDV